LLGGEFGDRRKDASGIAGKEDDVGRVLFGNARDQGIGNILDGVSAARKQLLEQMHCCKMEMALTYQRVFSVRVASS
jgi:hypothetical protein